MATRVNNINKPLALIVGVLILAPIVATSLVTAGLMESDEVKTLHMRRVRSGRMSSPLTADQCFIGLCLLET